MKDKVPSGRCRSKGKMFTSLRTGYPVPTWSYHQLAWELGIRTSTLDTMVRRHMGGSLPKHTVVAPHWRCTEGQVMLIRAVRRALLKWRGSPASSEARRVMRMSLTKMEKGWSKAG